MQRKMFGTTLNWPAGRPPSPQVVVDCAIPTEAENPQSWGVQVALKWIVNSGVVGALVPQITAIVTWGVRGGSFTAEIDVTNGASFNLVADSVRVAIRDDTIYDGVHFPGPGSPFTVSGNASPTPLIRTQPVTATEYFRYNGVDMTGGLGVLLVPPFSRRVSMARVGGPALSSYQLLVFDVTGATVAQVFVGDGGELEDYLLPDAAHGISAAVLGANITAIAAIFQLDL